MMFSFYSTVLLPKASFFVIFAFLHRHCLFKVGNIPYLDSCLSYWTVALSKSASDVVQESSGGGEGKEAHLGYAAEM